MLVQQEHGLALNRRELYRNPNGDCWLLARDPGSEQAFIIATRDIFICSNCGACHDAEVERCHACNTPMAGEVPVQRTLRIDNVEAAPVERITANDEERVRQGFDIQTVFSWPRREGRVQITEADFRCDDTSILNLQYANSAEISRINKGLRRRANRLWLT